MIPIRCPACQSARDVPRTLAGAKVRCPCGAEFVVPRQPAGSPAALTPAATSPQAVSPAAGAKPQIAVTCPSCGVTYGANASLAGTTLQCPCGNPVQIPQPVQDSLFDDYSLAPPENPLGSASTSQFAPLDRSDEDADHEVGSIYSYAINQISRGVSPRAVHRDLVSRGVPPDDAESVIMSAMPDGKAGSFVNRKRGWQHLKYGAGLFAIGILISAIMLPLGIVVVTILPIAGLFYMLYGLITGITGWQ